MNILVQDRHVNICGMKENERRSWNLTDIFHRGKKIYEVRFAFYFLFYLSLKSIFASLTYKTMVAFVFNS